MRWRAISLLGPAGRKGVAADELEQAAAATCSYYRAGERTMTRQRRQERGLIHRRSKEVPVRQINEDGKE
jgi:hypothetical protein